MVGRRSRGNGPGGEERGDGRPRVVPGRVSDPSSLLRGYGIRRRGGVDGRVVVLSDVDDSSGSVEEMDLVSNEGNLAALKLTSASEL